MNKYLIIIILFTSSLFGLSDDIPYDWSGQYGVISNNGRLMWNQDWSVGVLLFDGTFANYPTRFGTSYKNSYHLSNTSDYNNELHSFPDSSQIKSMIDYYRGDFSYDQLEIDVEFAEKNRVIVFNGFKRTYKGPYGQYADPIGSNNPLQQSYRLDYSSQDKNESLDLALGYFITDSRLNLGDPADFNHKEKIVSAGIGYSKDFTNWQYKVHGAMFQQYYSMDFDRTKVYLNRLHLNQFINKYLGNSALLKFGIEFDNQQISLVDSTKIERIWSTLYGLWEKGSNGVILGTTVAQYELFPYIKIWTRSSTESNVLWQSNFSYGMIPEHIMLRNITNETMFKNWLTANFYADMHLVNIPLNFEINYSNDLEWDNIFSDFEKYYEVSNNLISSSISTQIPLFRDWKIDAQYRHTFKHNFYSDGIGDRVKLGIIINENLFKDNLFAQLKLWSEACLNRNPNLGFQGFHYGPYTTLNTDLVLSDYWVFNLELSAKISNMTIMWKVNNILQTAESMTTNQIFPNLDEKYLFISNSNNFPPMNRFITFHVIWDFEN